MKHRTRTVQTLLAGAAVLFAAAMPLAAQDDPFRDSDFDGHWTGTIRAGGVETPVAINISADDELALVSVMLADGTDRAQNFDPFPTEVRKLRKKRIDVVVDSGREGLKADEITFILKYKKSTGTLRAKAKGALRGSGDLVRSEAARPLRAIWGGDFLLALDETEAEDGRLAVTEVRGFSWSDDADLQGPVTGTRNGDSVDFTIAARGGDLEFTGTLRGGDTEMRGELSLGAGAPDNTSFSRASGRGKPMKVQRFSPTDVAAGATTAITMSGKNFADGLQVDTDTPGVRVTGVDVTSQSRVTISTQVDDAVAAGSTVSLRVRNADGQAADRNDALTVTGGGDPTPGVSFAGAVQPIFNSNCASSGCHSSGSATGGLVLTEGQAFANIVNVPSVEQSSLMRVQPGDAEASYLVRKIRGDAGISGGRMPLNRAPLTSSEIQTIIDWVNQGAANNRLPR